jgi:hypothetical protein
MSNGLLRKASSRPRAFLLSILISLIYANIILFIPWDEISRAGFSDYENYVQNFKYYYENDISRIDLYGLTSVTEFFTHEVLWNELVLILCRVTGDVDIALRFISFCILFIFSYFILLEVTIFIAPLFLFNPALIDVAMSGIRNGFAWSLIIIAILGRSKPRRLILFVAAIFIHSSSLVLFFLYYFTKFTAHFLRGKALLFSAIVVGVVFGFALTVLNENLLGLIGDRRSGGEYLVGGNSFKQASIWLILLLLQCFSSSEYIKKNIFIISVLSWYLIMNLYIPSSYRIWACLLPLIALSVINLSAYKRKTFFYLYGGYLMIQYLYWSKFLFGTN